MLRVDGKAVHLASAGGRKCSVPGWTARRRECIRGRLGLLVPTDPNLETQVRQEGERQLQAAALADGILRTAQQNATGTITSLLQGLGFEKIDIRVVPVWGGRPRPPLLTLTSKNSELSGVFFS